MITNTLMTYAQWRDHVHHLITIADGCNRVEVRLRQMDKKVKWHFDFDYSECVAAQEMNSKVVDLRVSLHYIDDKYLRRGKKERWHESVLTLHVIFDNGESLNHLEALGGLGDYAPKYLKEKIKKVHDERVRNNRGYFGGNVRSSNPFGPLSGKK